IPPGKVAAPVGAHLRLPLSVCSLVVAIAVVARRVAVPHCGTSAPLCDHISPIASIVRVNRKPQSCGGANRACNARLVESTDAAMRDACPLKRCTGTGTEMAT